MNHSIATAIAGDVFESRAKLQGLLQQEANLAISKAKGIATVSVPLIEKKRSYFQDHLAAYSLTLSSRTRIADYNQESKLPKEAQAWV